MSNPEIVVNLWYIVSRYSGLISDLAGRVYYLDGTDDDKVALLKRLAATDHHLATRSMVPERFVANDIAGYCPVDELNNPETTLFEELYQELEHELNMRLTLLEPLKIPDNPLFVVTCLLENEDGTLTPVE